MAYRNKAFVSFDGDTDIHYYRLMRAWKQRDGTTFDFFDAHDINTARDTSTEETIRRRLGERLANTKVLVSLVGERTRYLYRFVRWELEQAISRDIPIIACNTNGSRHLDSDRCPPVIRDHLVMHVSFNAKILQYALENWPAQYRNLRVSGGSGPYYYEPSIYQGFGL